MELSIEPKLQLLSPLPVCIDPRNGCKWGSMQRLQVCGGGGQAAVVAGGQKEEQAAPCCSSTRRRRRPGLRLSPNVVLIMSIGFIAFVGILHVLGKLYLVPRSS